MISINLLEYFLKFYECGNLTKASEELFISQPSLTRSMKKLEEELGLPLFNRTGNKITINENGQELVQPARDVLSAHQRLLEHMAEWKIAKTTLRIGLVAPGPLLKYGPLLYRAFTHQQIATMIKDERSLIDDLLQDKIDLVFINHPLNDKNVYCQKCFDEQLYLLVPATHFVAGMKQGIHFQDVDGQSFLMDSEIGSWNQVVETHLSHSRFFLQNSANLLDLINASTIPSFATNVTSFHHVVGDRIQIPFLDDDAKMPFYIAYLKTKASHLRRFLEAIKQENERNELNGY